MPSFFCSPAISSQRRLFSSSTVFMFSALASKSLSFASSWACRSATMELSSLPALAGAADAYITGCVDGLDFAVSSVATLSLSSSSCSSMNVPSPSKTGMPTVSSTIAQLSKRSIFTTREPLLSVTSSKVSVREELSALNKKLGSTFRW